jgi:hypothetical protein
MALGVLCFSKCLAKAPPVEDGNLREERSTFKGISEVKKNVSDKSDVSEDC